MSVQLVIKFECLTEAVAQAMLQLVNDQLRPTGLVYDSEIVR